MFGISFPELLLIFIVALCVLGPKQLPIAARQLGHWIARARMLKQQLDQSIDDKIKQETLAQNIKRAQEKNTDVSDLM
jgi:sec-independent protein translocase protein TatB